MTSFENMRILFVGDNRTVGHVNKNDLDIVHALDPNIKEIKELCLAIDTTLSLYKVDLVVIFCFLYDILHYKENNNESQIPVLESQIPVLELNQEFEAEKVIEVASFYHKKWKTDYIHTEIFWTLPAVPDLLKYYQMDEKEPLFEERRLACSLQEKIIYTKLQEMQYFLKMSNIPYFDLRKIYIYGKKQKATRLSMEDNKAPLPRNDCRTIDGLNPSSSVKHRFETKLKKFYYFFYSSYVHYINSEVQAKTGKAKEQHNGKKNSKSHNKEGNEDIAYEFLSSSLDEETQKEYLEKEEKCREKFEEEYAIWEDVAELHPNYDELRDEFFTKYKSKMVGMNESNKDNLWKKFWSKKFTKVKAKDWKARKEALYLDLKAKKKLDEWNLKIKSEVIIKEEPLDTHMEMEEVITDENNQIKEEPLFYEGNNYMQYSDSPQGAMAMKLESECTKQSLQQNSSLFYSNEGIKQELIEFTVVGCVHLLQEVCAFLKNIGTALYNTLNFFQEHGVGNGLSYMNHVQHTALLDLAEAKLRYSLTEKQSTEVFKKFKFAIAWIPKLRNTIKLISPRVCESALNVDKLAQDFYGQDIALITEGVRTAFVSKVHRIPLAEEVQEICSCIEFLHNMNPRPV